MKQKIIKSISIFAIGLILLANNVSLVLAQSPVTPTVYCVGGVGAPPCAAINPTETDEDDAPEISPTVNTISAAPTDVDEDPDQGDDEPCLDSSDTSVQHYGGKHRHRGEGGFIQMFFRFLMLLIEYLLGGGGGDFPIPGIGNPNPTDTPSNPQPCGTTPTVTQTPSVSPQPTSIVSATPGTTNPSVTTQPTTGAGASCTQADIQRLVDSVSQANIEANLKAIVQDDSKPQPNELISRHVSSPGNQIKVDWAKQKMASYGLQVVEQPFTSGGYSLQNAIGRINGSSPDTLYAVGGHIDTMNNYDDDYDPAQPAPGADDDASGVVVAMEAGRVLNGFKQCLKSSIDFVGWNDEEEEMNGSATYVQNLAGKTFKGAISSDMIGYAPNGECLKSAVRKGVDTSLAQKLVDMNTKYNVGLNVTVSSSDADLGDDAGNFWDANLPAVYPIECSTETDSENYPGYHTKDDTTQNVNIPQLVKTTKIIVAALAELASQ